MQQGLFGRAGSVAARVAHGVAGYKSGLSYKDTVTSGPILIKGSVQAGVWASTQKGNNWAAFLLKIQHIDASGSWADAPDSDYAEGGPWEPPTGAWMNTQIGAGPGNSFHIARTYVGSSEWIRARMEYTGTSNGNTSVYTCGAWMVKQNPEVGGVTNLRAV